MELTYKIGFWSFIVDYIKSTDHDLFDVAIDKCCSDVDIWCMLFDNGYRWGDGRDVIEYIPDISYDYYIIVNTNDKTMRWTFEKQDSSLSYEDFCEAIKTETDN